MGNIIVIFLNGQFLLNLNCEVSLLTIPFFPLWDNFSLSWNISSRGSFSEGVLGINEFSFLNILLFHFWFVMLFVFWNNYRFTGSVLCPLFTSPHLCKENVLQSCNIVSIPGNWLVIQTTELIQISPLLHALISHSLSVFSKCISLCKDTIVKICSEPLPQFASKYPLQTRSPLTPSICNP